MEFVDQLKSAPTILTGGSLFERMRRDPDVAFDPEIKHAALVYHRHSREVLAAVYRSYMDVATRHALPMLVSASTWRASAERIARSVFAGKPVNQDNIDFVREVIADSTPPEAPMYVAGVLGSRGDAYRPEEGLSVEAAIKAHEPQVRALRDGDPDVLLAATLPALPEARGIARCFEESGLPYLLSFIVRDSGTLLDGTPLAQALDTIDGERGRPPAGYMVNCVHPTVLERCLETAGPNVEGRIIGLRANTSPLRPEELDGSEVLISTPPADLAADMRRVQRRGLRILGGCCGTDTSHLEAIAATCKDAP